MLLDQASSGRRRAGRIRTSAADMVRAAVRVAVIKAVVGAAGAPVVRAKEDGAVRNAWSVPGKMIRLTIRDAIR
jgi:hypothetical protein